MTRGGPRGQGGGGGAGLRRDAHHDALRPTPLIRGRTLWLVGDSLTEVAALLRSIATVGLRLA